MQHRKKWFPQKLVYAPSFEFYARVTRVEAANAWRLYDALEYTLPFPEYAFQLFQNKEWFDA